VDWLLQKKERDKLTLKNYLMRQPFPMVPIKQVINDLGWSKYLVMNYGQALADDLAQLDQHELVSFDGARQHFIVRPGHSMLFDELRLQYLNRAPKYHLLMALLFGTFETVADFAVQHDFSTPYVRELLQELQQDLQPYHIQINDSYILIGNEKEVRYFFFRILFDYYTLQSNPLPAAAIEWAQTTWAYLKTTSPNPISPAISLIVEFQLGIWYVRMTHQHIITPSDSAPVLDETTDLPATTRLFLDRMREHLTQSLGLSDIEAGYEARFALSALYAFGFARKEHFETYMPIETRLLFSVVSDIIARELPAFFGNAYLMTHKLIDAIQHDLYTTNLRLVYFHSALRPEPNVDEAISQFPVYAQLTQHLIQAIATETNIPHDTLQNTLFEDYFNTFITRLPQEEVLPIITVDLEFVDNAALGRRLAQLMNNMPALNIILSFDTPDSADLVISNTHLSNNQRHLYLKASPTLAEIEEIRQVLHQITVQKFERFTGQTIPVRFS